jgi:hypothetical protein
LSIEVINIYLMRKQFIFYRLPDVSYNTGCNPSRVGVNLFQDKTLGGNINNNLSAKLITVFQYLF